MNRIFRVLPLAALTALAFSAYGDDTTGRLSSETQEDIQQNVQWREGQWGSDLEWLKHHRGLEKIKNVVVIYAENRGFDNLYGLFPGANGLRHARRSSLSHKGL